MKHFLVYLDVDFFNCDYVFFLMEFVKAGNRKVKKELCSLSIYKSDDCTDIKKANCNQHVILPNKKLCAQISKLTET